jgi:dihydrofolate reductase
MLLGRRTYEIFAAHRLYAGDNPITDGFNRAIKYVATRGTPEFEWINSQALQGDAVEAVRQLKARGSRQGAACCGRAGRSTMRRPCRSRAL